MPLLTSKSTKKVWRLYKGIGRFETVTLESMISNDSTGQFFDGSSQTDYTVKRVRRKKMYRGGQVQDPAHALQDQEKYTTFQIYQEELTKAGAPDPKINDFLFDANSQRYVILSVIEQRLIVTGKRRVFFLIL